MLYYVVLFLSSSHGSVFVFFTVIEYTHTHTQELLLVHNVQVRYVRITDRKIITITARVRAFAAVVDLPGSFCGRYGHAKPGWLNRRDIVVFCVEFEQIVQLITHF